MERALLLNVAITYPIIITFASIFYTLITLDSVGILFAVGNVLLGFGANIYLKRLFRYFFPNISIFQRPNPPNIGCGLFPDCFRNKQLDKFYSYGMPSGHAQISTMVAVFWSLYILNNKDLTIGSYLSIILIISMTIIVSYSRIYLGCHNILQITIGCIIGLFFGLLLYKIIDPNNKEKISNKITIQIGIALILIMSIFFMILG